MEPERIQELLTKYNEGLADPSELALVEQLIESGDIDLAQLNSLSKLDTQLHTLEFPSPSPELDHQFYRMLGEWKKEQKGFSWSEFFSWPQLAPKLAFASVLLLVGFSVGYLIKPSGVSNQQVDVLTQEVTDLKEMMMLSLLEKESATERLKAVSLTSDMGSVSNKVTDALLQTLNNDENINVRLAALDALKPYVQNSKVREAVIRSIAVQESPLVQVALAELMSALQEKSSVKEFEKILKSEKTPADVKKRIEENLKVMI
jgi:hypothetical protein